jgi:hypothetical protein
LRSLKFRDIAQSAAKRTYTQALVFECVLVLPPRLNNSAISGKADYLPARLLPCHGYLNSAHIIVQSVKYIITKENLVKRMEEILNQMPMNTKGAKTEIVHRALELWLDVEGPVYMEAFSAAKKRIRLVKPDSVSENPAELQ